jgi:hypothetical protein
VEALIDDTFLLERGKKVYAEKGKTYNQAVNIPNFDQEPAHWLRYIRRRIRRLG